MTKNFLKSESAVSEVIGFIFVFSIVMLAISVIYAVGYPAIQSSKENTQFQNMEQSFMVLQSNINRVAFGQAPVRTLETSLGGGSLTVYPSEYLSEEQITVKNTTGTPIWEGTIGAIEYEKNGRSIAYVGGGVWKKYPVGSAIKVSAPRIFVHDTSDGNRTVFVSIINISGELSSVGGEGATSVTVRSKTSTYPLSITSFDDDGEKIKITVTSYYADAWRRYFEDMGFDVNGVNPVIATISNVDTLIVNEHVIEVEVS